VERRIVLVVEHRTVAVVEALHTDQAAEHHIDLAVVARRTDLGEVVHRTGLEVAHHIDLVAARHIDLEAVRHTALEVAAHRTVRVEGRHIGLAVVHRIDPEEGEHHIGLEEEGNCIDLAEARHTVPEVAGHSLAGVDNLDSALEVVDDNLAVEVVRIPGEGEL
jgi:hypothetical protein